MTITNKLRNLKIKLALDTISTNELEELIELIEFIETKDFEEIKRGVVSASVINENVSAVSEILKSNYIKGQHDEV